MPQDFGASSLYLKMAKGTDFQTAFVPLGGACPGVARAQITKRSRAVASRNVLFRIFGRSLGEKEFVMMRRPAALAAKPGVRASVRAVCRRRAPELESRG